MDTHGMQWATCKMYLYSCLGKHLNLVRGVVLASGHVAEVDHVAEGGHNRVEEEA